MISRRDMLKRLGIGSLAAVSAPLASQQVDKREPASDIYAYPHVIVNGDDGVLAVYYSSDGGITWTKLATSQ